jgi:hypothetical protein
MVGVAHSVAAEEIDAMSNQVRRPPLRGMIIQGDRIVGGLDLPEPTGPFVEHFNREYARLGMRIELSGQAHAQGESRSCHGHLASVAGVGV